MVSFPITLKDGDYMNYAQVHNILFVVGCEQTNIVDHNMLVTLIP